MRMTLCAATEMEISSTIAFITDRALPVDILITGVGLTAATYNITRAIYEHRPTMMLQAGIAGSLNPQLNLGEVVTVKSETIGDLGVYEEGQFKSIFGMKLTGVDEAPWKAMQLVNGEDQLSALSYRQVVSVSINEISTDSNRMDYYRNALGADIESMEGAALHYVCLLEKIPFLQLRSISNYAGERNKQNWKIKTAIESLNEAIQAFILKQLDL